MKLHNLVGAAIVAASVTALAAPANAEDHLRGGITSVKNVASTLAGQNEYVEYTWAKGRATTQQSTEPVSDNGNFKWAAAADAKYARVADTAATTADAAGARHRWRIKADATQARHRWRIKADATQARHRWRIKADATQARHRWRIKADATQARHRWRIK